MGSSMGPPHIDESEARLVPTFGFRFTEKLDQAFLRTICTIVAMNVPRRLSILVRGVNAHRVIKNQDFFGA